MGRYLDIGGTRYLLEQLHDIMEKMLVGNVDLSDYVTQSELQTILDGLQIDVDLSAYATKEELENAIKGIDLSAYATTQYVNTAIANAQLGGGDVDLSDYALKTDLDAKAEKEHTHTMSEITDYEEPDLSDYATKSEIPSLDGYATEEYVDNALANAPAGEVDLSNYYNKEEVNEKDMMIVPFNCFGDRIVTDDMPNIKVYAGTNIITFEDNVEVTGGILVNGVSPYYFNDYVQINGNAVTFEAESECNVRDYVFTIGDRPDGLTTLAFTITNGDYIKSYIIPLHENDIDGSEYVYYRKIWGAPLYIKGTKLKFAQSSLTPINKQVYENRDAIKELQKVKGVDLSDFYNKKEINAFIDDVDIYKKAKEQGGAIKNFYPAMPDSMYDIITSGSTTPNVRFSLNTTEWNIEKYVGETINELGTSHDFSVDRIVLASTVSKEDLLNKVDATVLIADNDGIWMYEITDGEFGRVRKFSSKNDSPNAVTPCNRIFDINGNIACPDFTNTFFHYDDILATIQPPNLDYFDYVTPVYFKYIPLGYFRNNYGTHTYSGDNTFKYIGSTFTLNSEEIVKSILDDYFVVNRVDEHTEYYTREEWALMLDNATKNEANVDLSNYYTKPEVDALIPTVSDGKDGTDGKDGFSPIATVTKADGVATISITDANGTTTVTVSDGVNGQDGKDGTNGTNGQDGTDGYTPVRGTDYWTEQDIQTIKDYIDTELGVIENGTY